MAAAVEEGEDSLALIDAAEADVGLWIEEAEVGLGLGGGEGEGEGD